MHIIAQVNICRIVEIDVPPDIDLTSTRAKERSAQKSPQAQEENIIRQPVGCKQNKMKRQVVAQQGLDPIHAAP